jgi:two-component system, sensor histidine kinase and response regulator
VDVQTALRRLGGDVEIYRQVVADFIEMEASAWARIGEALATGDLGLATRLAHTLRGLAATVGAADLATEAGKLEKSLRAGNVDEGRRELASVEGRLRDVVHLLSELVDAGPGPAPTSPAQASAVDVARAEEILRELAQRLDEGSPDAVDCARDLIATLPGAEFAAGLDALARALASLDFETAQQAARELAAKLAAG